MTARRVLLLRHGVTEWNAARRFQGHEDIPLSEPGLAQAQRAAEVLSTYGPTRVVSSDLSRASQTAGFVASASGLQVEVDERFREVNVGSWSGLSLDTIGEREPDFWPAINEGRDFRRSPEGETATEAGRRVADALREVTAATPDTGVLIVVGHGLALSVATLLLMGLDYSYARLFGGLANCGWNELSPASERWKLRAYNRVAENPLADGGVA